MVTEKKPKTVGIYKLAMKQDSDNYRNSAMKDIIKNLKEENANIIIYEPTLDNNEFNDCKVINNFNEFAQNSDMILANRFDSTLMNFKDKVYTRDLFGRD